MSVFIFGSKNYPYSGHWHFFKTMKIYIAYQWHLYDIYEPCMCRRCDCIKKEDLPPFSKDFYVKKFINKVID